jgi:hypothetical protein
MSEKIKVLIDRSKWRTGLFSAYRTGAGLTRLLNVGGYMCCLGFCCRAAGVSDDDLMHRSKPSTLQPGLQRLLPGLQPLFTYTIGDQINSDLTVAAITINDCTNTPPFEKEKKLLELFKDSGFELEFTGEYSQKDTENDN